MLFGTFFGHFEKLKIYPVFWIFPSFVPTGCTGHVFPRNYIQTSSTIAWTLSGMFLDAFEKSFLFVFFFDFFQVSTLQGAVGKKNSKKLPRASLDTFGNGFRDFGTLKFFPFLWIFFSLQGALGRAFSVEKISQNILKQCFLGTFLDNFEIFEVFPFLKVFSKPQPYRVQWRFFFRKKITSNRFRTCSDNIRDNFGHLRNIESFHFFPSFLFSSLQCALGKNLTGNMISKHV